MNANFFEANHITRHANAIYLVTPAKALGLVPQTHAFVSLDTG